MDDNQRKIVKSSSAHVLINSPNKFIYHYSTIAHFPAINNINALELVHLSKEITSIHTKPLALDFLHHFIKKSQALNHKQV